MRRAGLVAAVVALAVAGGVPARAATLPRAFSVDVAAQVFVTGSKISVRLTDVTSTPSA